jgi:hypothetical protein
METLKTIGESESERRSLPRKSVRVYPRRPSAATEGIAVLSLKSASGAPKMTKTA